MTYEPSGATTGEATGPENAVQQAQAFAVFTVVGICVLLSGMGFKVRRLVAGSGPEEEEPYVLTGTPGTLPEKRPCGCGIAAVAAARIPGAPDTLLHHRH